MILIKKLNFGNFPSLFFEHKGLGYKFSLNSTDLFLFDEDNNNYILLVFAREYSKDNWNLGTSFLKKYQFVSNEESKTLIIIFQIITLNRNKK